MQALATAEAPVRLEQLQPKIELFAFPLRGPRFQLDDTFLAEFVDQQPAWGPVGYVTYKRTYSRYQDPDRGGAHRTVASGDSEEYWQTCARVVEGVYQIQQRHCQQVGTPWLPRKAQRSAQTMYRLMWEFKFLPPGRGLWMMGTPFIEEHGAAALNNCAFVSTVNIDQDFADPFTFLMDMSMLGVGVGGDTRGAGKVVIDQPEHADDVHVIPDSREGWIHAVVRLLHAYVGDDQLPAAWDYSLVRGAGEPIRGFGGTAAGPGPLRQLLEYDIPSVLDPLIGQRITGAAIVDLFNFIGKCVVAGNVRRSAEIMFGDPDAEFLDLKNPDLHAAELESHRWASNNSVFGHVGMDYSEVAGRIVKNGEPGLLWLDNVRNYGRMVDPMNPHRDHRVVGANPCMEQSLEDHELCCLVESFPAHHDSYEEMQLTWKYAYLYAKTVTLVPTHNARTNAVMMRNRRIGTSQSGIVQSFARHGRRTHFEWCDRGYRFLQDLDEQYSDWMCVRRSIKMTSVKPSGTVSKLCGATSGIHYPPAKWYIQRIRFGANSPLLAPLREAGYPMEPCVYTPNTIVVEFPVETPHVMQGERDVSMWEQLANAAAMQKYWADNQVSCTVKFDPATEGSDIQAALELYEDQLKGISFLPHDHGYKQAPWEPITVAEYDARVRVLSPLNLTGDTHEITEKFCDGDTCQI